MTVSPIKDRKTRFLAGKQGMLLFLLSLGMLFAASVAGFFVIRIRLQMEGVWPDDLPSLPSGLWISTAILIISSVSMEWAAQSARLGRAGSLSIGMMITALLGFAFLIAQSSCWYIWLEPVSQRWEASNEYRFALSGFYVLTGLHAAHVIGGLIPIAAVTVRSLRGRYTTTNHAGVRYCAMYWHFLGAVWIVLFATLKLGA